LYNAKQAVTLNERLCINSKTWLDGNFQLLAKALNKIAHIGLHTGLTENDDTQLGIHSN